MTRNLLVFAVVPACIALHFAVLPISASAGGVCGVGGVTETPLINNRGAGTNHGAQHEQRYRPHRHQCPDGAFAVLALEPGLYQVAAAKEGFTQSTTNVYVATPRPYRVDLLLAADNSPVPEPRPLRGTCSNGIGG